jgi:hypothetical protein
LQEPAPANSPANSPAPAPAPAPAWGREIPRPATQTSQGGHSTSADGAGTGVVQFGAIQQALKHHTHNNTYYTVQLPQCHTLGMKLSHVPVSVPQQASSGSHPSAHPLVTGRGFGDCAGTGAGTIMRHAVSHVTRGGVADRAGVRPGVEIVQV